MFVKIRYMMDKILPNIAMIFFLIAVFSTVIGVADRTFGLQIKAVWAEELSRYTMIWATLLLIGIGIRKGTQTRLTLLTDVITKRSARMLEILVYALTAFMFSLLLIYGVRSAVINRMQISPVMQISMLWPYFAIPTSSFFVVLECIMLICEFLRQPTEKERMP